MWLFPSKSQFVKWSLPSKLTFLSFWLGIFSIIVAPIICHIISDSPSKDDIAQLPQKEDFKVIEERLTAKMGEIQREKENQFLRMYNLGYQLVAFDRYNNVIPFDSKIRFDYEIDWDKTKISQQDDIINITLPSIKSFKNQGLYEGNVMQFREGYIGIVNSFNLAGAKLFLEAIEYDYYGYICVIGLTDKLISK